MVLFALCFSCCSKENIKEGMEPMKNIHIIVAAGEWETDHLRYRRHRFAEFLSHQPDTQEIIWVCPTPRKVDTNFQKLSNNITQYLIQDILPHKLFRFGRYIDSFYKAKMRQLVLYLEQYHRNYQIYLWYTFPGFPLLSDIFSWNKVVYDCSDLWTAPISGKSSLTSVFRQKLISKAENRIIQKADTVYCTSDYLRSRIVEKRQIHENVYTLENGVEFELFASEQDKMEKILPADFDGTVLGYIGGIKPKLDFELIQKVARKRRDWLILFVGPDGTNSDSEFKQVIKEENVVWIDSVPPTDVPKYMNLIDIGIMPYKPSQYNQAVFPLKLFEFLASGKPVIGVHLPSTKKYTQKFVYHLLEKDNPEEFIQVCEQLEKNKRQETNVRLRKQLAKTKDWNSVFENMICSM